MMGLGGGDGGRVASVLNAEAPLADQCWLQMMSEGGSSPTWVIFVPFVYRRRRRTFLLSWGVFSFIVQDFCENCVINVSQSIWNHTAKPRSLDRASPPTPGVYRSASHTVWGGRLYMGRLVFAGPLSAAMTGLELIETENLLQISSLQAGMERSKEAPRPRRPPPPPPPHRLPLQHRAHIHAPLSLVHPLQAHFHTTLQKARFFWNEIVAFDSMIYES